MVFLIALAAAFGVGLFFVWRARWLIGPISIRNGKDLQLTSGLLFAQVAIYLPLLAVAIPLLPFVARRSWRQIGLHRPTASDVRAGSLGAVAMYLAAFVAALAQKFALHIEGKQQAVQLFGTTHDRTLIYGLIVLAVFVAPVVEEVMFRGFLFNAFLRYAPAGVAVVASGIIFSLAHSDMSVFFPLACAGTVLAVVYYRTGSLVASMVTHGTFNAANVVLVLITGGKG